MLQQLQAQVVIFENTADVDDYVLHFNQIFKETVDNYIPACKIFKKQTTLSTAHNEADSFEKT